MLSHARATIQCGLSDLPIFGNIGRRLGIASMIVTPAKAGVQGNRSAAGHGFPLAWE